MCRTVYLRPLGTSGALLWGIYVMLPTLHRSLQDTEFRLLDSDSTLQLTFCV